MASEKEWELEIMLVLSTRKIEPDGAKLDIDITVRHIVTLSNHMIAGKISKQSCVITCSNGLVAAIALSYSEVLKAMRTEK